MKKFIIAAAVIAVGLCSAVTVGGCNTGKASVEYTLSEDGTYYIVSGVSGDKRGLTSYEVPAEYSAEEGGELLPVKEIGYEAFFRCTELVGMTLPDTIETIGERAFAYSAITSIEIPYGVKKIGYAAFGACDGLTEVTVPQTVSKIEPFAFAYCTRLKTAVVKAEITVLEASVFYNSVVSFGGGTYTNTALTKVYLPATLEKIHYYALAGNAITDIYFAGAEDEWNELYFYKMELIEGTGDEYEEKRYTPSDALPGTVKIHYDEVF